MKILNLSLLSASLLLASACDVSDKQIGDETQGSGSECEAGQTMEPDACNTCSCEDGSWSCTEMGCLDEPFDQCDGSNGQPDFCAPGCVPGTIELADGCSVCECQSDQTWSCDDTTEALSEDGCACSCEDGEWACTEGNCFPDANPFDGPQLALCGADVPHKELFVLDASLEGDIMSVEVQYTGGCELHFLGGCWNRGFDESAPVQVGLSIAHAGPEDFCEAGITEVVEVDLTTLRDQYAQSYQTQTGVIDISLAGWDQGLQYTF